MKRRELLIGLGSAVASRVPLKLITSAGSGAIALVSRNVHAAAPAVPGGTYLLEVDFGNTRGWTVQMFNHGYAARANALQKLADAAYAQGEYQLYNRYLSEKGDYVRATMMPVATKATGVATTKVSFGQVHIEGSMTNLVLRAIRDDGQMIDTAASGTSLVEQYRYPTGVIDYLFGFSTSYEVVVRLIPASGLLITSSFSSIDLVTNSALHSSIAGLTPWFPELYQSSDARVADRALRVFQHTSGLDTLAMPHTMVSGQSQRFVLTSTLSGAQSKDESDSLVARFERHMEAFGAALAADIKAGIHTTEHAIHAVGNEALKLVGGDELVKGLQAKYNEVMATIESYADWEKAETMAWLQRIFDTAQSYGSEAEVTRLSRLLTTTLPQPTDARIGFSTGLALNLQFAFKSPQLSKDPESRFMGVALRLGFRLGYGLAQARYLKTNAGGTVKTYGAAKETTSTGVKFGIVGIVGVVKVGSFSIDIEVSFNCTWKASERKLRLDSVVFDPVFDVDMKSRVENLAKKAYAKIFPPLPAPTGALPVDGERTLAQVLASMDFTRTNGGVLDFPLAVPLPNTVEQATKEMRQYQIVEGSPLRFTWTNGDIGNPAQPFRSGWHTPRGFGYSPAVKYIGGVGVQRTGPTGSITYLRLVVIADAGMVSGNAWFMQAAGSRFNH
jgi:hypothetical protein